MFLGIFWELLGFYWEFFGGFFVIFWNFWEFFKNFLGFFKNFLCIFLDFLGNFWVFFSLENVLFVSKEAENKQFCSSEYQILSITQNEERVFRENHCTRPRST